MLGHDLKRAPIKSNQSQMSVKSRPPVMESRILSKQSAKDAANNISQLEISDDEESKRDALGQTGIGFAKDEMIFTDE